jgi:hypothetical protein
MRHYIHRFADFHTPAPRADAYYGAFMSQARAALEAARYSFDDLTGREYESGREVSRYSNPADYNPADYGTREAIFRDVFARAIRSRAARLANRSRK